MQVMEKLRVQGPDGAKCARQSAIWIGVVLVLSGCTADVDRAEPSGQASSTETAAASLESWSDGASRDSIVGFVERVSDAASPDFVPPSERVAVFDNDGTLWSEQPLYF